MRFMTTYARSRRRCLATTAASAVMAAAFGGNALAQETDDGAGSREVIVVTAQKREQTVFDVPASVSVVSGESLENAAATTLADYAALIPGVNFASEGSPGQGTIVLRGVPPLGGSATVGIYIDEAPMGSSGIYARQNVFALDLFPYDIERIEVVRGPQGTLYGASATGGILKYITRKPNLDAFEARAGGDVSFIENADDASYSARASVTAPIVPGIFAVSLSGYHNETAGYIDAPVRGEEGVNETLRQGARLAGLFRPNDRFTGEFTLLTQKIESDDNNWTFTDFFTLEPIAGDLETGLPLASPFEQQIDYASGTLTYELDWAQVTSVTTKSTMDSTQKQDVTPGFVSALDLFTGGAVTDGYVPFTLNMQIDRLTQEFRLTSTTDGPVDWLVGAYYSNEEMANDQVVNAWMLDGSPVPGLDPLGTANIPHEYEEIALFGDVTVHFTDRFDVTAGLRWSKNDQTFSQISGGALLGFIDTEETGASNEEVVTGMVSPRFDLTDNIAVYARYATGYRPGGPNVILPIVGIPSQVDADTIESLEVGAKADFWNGRGAVDIAVFQNDWKDIQASVGMGGVSYQDNAGDAEITGVEVSSLLELFDGFELGASAAFTDAEFVDGFPGLNANPGDPLPLVPDWQGALTASYERPVANGWRLALGGSWRYVGEYVTYDAVYGSRTTESHDILDLRAGVSNETWGVRLFARNALDERAQLNNGLQYDQVSGAPLYSLTSVAQPRTLGIALDVQY